jgi:hypothetical protein
VWCNAALCALPLDLFSGSGFDAAPKCNTMLKKRQYYAADVPKRLLCDTRVSIRLGNTLLRSIVTSVMCVDSCCIQAKVQNMAQLPGGSYRGGGGGAEWYGCPGQHTASDSEVNILNEKI